MDVPQIRTDVEQDHFPLVFVRLGGPLTETAAAVLTMQLHKTLDRALSDDAYVFMVIDARRVSKMGAGFRQTFGEWEASITDELFARIRVRVIVHENPVVRGALTAMAWLSPRIKEIATAKTADGAIAALRQADQSCGELTAEQESIVRQWLDDEF